MKKRAFMLVGILLISIVMSACRFKFKIHNKWKWNYYYSAEYPVYDTAEEIVDGFRFSF